MNYDTFEWDKLGISEDEVVPTRRLIIELVDNIQDCILSQQSLRDVINAQSNTHWDEWVTTNNKEGYWRHVTKDDCNNLLNELESQSKEYAKQLINLIHTYKMDDIDKFFAILKVENSEIYAILKELSKLQNENKLEWPIEQEHKMRMTQLHKQESRGKAEIREDRENQGSDISFSWDACHRKNYQPAFKPRCYQRNVDNIKTFIPNVRILMDSKRMSEPVSLSKNWYPEEVFSEFDCPTEYYTQCGHYNDFEVIQEELTVFKQWITVNGKPKEFEYKTKRSVTKSIVKKKLLKWVNGKPVYETKKVSYLTKSGLPFRGSKEIGPPCQYNEQGKVTKFWCYADNTKTPALYTIVGSWATNLRKQFLEDVHDGSVNICKAIEYIGKKRITKHQAFKIYATKFKMKKPDGQLYWQEQNVLLFCDIKPISNSKFLKEQDKLEIMRLEKMNFLDMNW